MLGVVKEATLFKAQHSAIERPNRSSPTGENMSAKEGEMPPMKSSAGAAASLEFQPAGGVAGVQDGRGG